MLFPTVWERVAAPLSTRAGQALQSARGQGGIFGNFLLGAALGPVFNSFSPTYALIVAAILPTSFGRGLTYLAAYAVGLGLALLLIALLGRALVAKLNWAANPEGWFHRLIGILLVVVGIAVIFGLDKSFQTFVLDKGYYQSISEFELKLRQ
jgi:cytochrome c biogenesis protein CcdA